MIFEHKSVLLNETVDSLNIKEDGIYVDGTLGGAGHASLVCSKLQDGKLIGIDQDKDAIAVASERLDKFGKDKFVIVRDNYCNIKSVLENLGIKKVDGIYLDLGVSSYQLDTASRGFTYRVDAPLDMRMDDRKEETAGELTEIIRGAIPMKIQLTGGHPAKRTFQALRIELNEELKVLEDSIDVMIDLLNTGGRLSIISFHSLEDRIVKNIFRRNENPCTCPKNFPMCVCGNTSKGKVVTRKAILPSEEEILYNSRSKSAKLRVFEKI